MINMISVSSSDVKAVGYNKGTFKLFINYLNNTYVYFNVPEIEYINLLATNFKCKYFNLMIKPRYRFQQIS